MSASRDRLYHDVEVLTALQPARNHANLASLNRAADYITAEFNKLDGRVTVQPFRVERREYKNIIASFGPADAERVVVGAHYDVCGDQPGADDNASAVAGLLETARLLSAGKPDLPYRVDFVAYSLEEPPYFATDKMGSAVHAKSLHDAKVEVKGMICYEMIGYFSDAPGSQGFPDPAMAKVYPNRGNFILVLGKNGQEAFSGKIKAHMKAHSQIDVQSIHFNSTSGLAGLSDHRNYWKYNYPAVMINDTAFLRNPNYHRPSDTLDTLDFDKMTEVVNGVYAALIRL
ncbi:MAG TPA: M28 family peptidase [Cytophagales bacterium]|jgi:Zn-dependent M28 family amino/carboxypeptidase